MAQRIHPNDLLAYDLYAFACLLAVARRAGVFNPANPNLRRSMLTTGVSSAQVDDILDRAAKVWEAAEQQPPLSDTLTAVEAAEVAADDGWLSEVVTIDLDVFIDNDLEGVLDALGEQLVEGGEILEQISYEVVANRGNSLCVRVSGDASTLLGMHEEEEDDSIDDTSVEEEPNPLAHGLTVHEDLPDFDDLDFGDDEDEDE